MLEIAHVTKQYGNKVAVSDVTLNVEDGRVVALLGPNGSGKTTLMKMIAGLVSPTAGEIAFDGEKIGPATKRRIAYMPTEAYFYNYMSARDAGRYYRDFLTIFPWSAICARLRKNTLTPRQRYAPCPQAWWPRSSWR